MVHFACINCGASQIYVLSSFWIIMVKEILLWLIWEACFQLLSVNQEFVRGSVFNGDNTVLDLLDLFLGWKECSSYWWWNRYSEIPYLVLIPTKLQKLYTLKPPCVTPTTFWADGFITLHCFKLLVSNCLTPHGLIFLFTAMYTHCATQSMQRTFSENMELHIS